MLNRSILEVNLNTLEDNYKKLIELAPENKVLFMVKADAYGHGMIPIVKFCFEQLNITEFGVASLAQAVQLRTELINLPFEIYVFSDIQLFDEDSISYYLNKRLTPVISDVDNLKLFLSNKDFKSTPLVLKFNTGMNRLGLDGDHTSEVINELKKSGVNKIDHMMSHFACSSLSIKKSNRNQKQLDKFKNILEEFKNNNIEIKDTSISNSGAIEQKQGLEFTHIRPGLMLYGPSSLIPRDSGDSFYKGKLISSLKARVLFTTKIEKGTPIGYGAGACPANGLLAIVAFGYGDGLRTNISSSEIIVNGHVGKIVGRVNMDMIYILFECAAEKNVLVNQIITIWDKFNSNFENLCLQSKAIAYELLCSLTHRVVREYTYQK